MLHKLYICYLNSFPHRDFRFKKNGLGLHETVECCQRCSELVFIFFFSYNISISSSQLRCVHFWKRFQKNKVITQKIYIKYSNVTNVPSVTLFWVGVNVFLRIFHDHFSARLHSRIVTNASFSPYISVFLEIPSWSH